MPHKNATDFFNFPNYYTAVGSVFQVPISQKQKIFSSALSIESNALKNIFMLTNTVYYDKITI